MGGKSSEGNHFVAEEFVVEGPALQIVDGGRLRFLVRTMDDEKTEEIRPSRLQHGPCFRLEPNLMLVAFVVRRSAQEVRGLAEEESLFFRELAEDSEVLVEIGSTALKARNCFAAASELRNKCWERDSFRSEAWFMVGH
jgi:hypothetical protein